MMIFDNFLAEEHSFSETFVQKPVKVLRMGAGDFYDLLFQLLMNHL
jgi:hypothetical protein